MNCCNLYNYIDSFRKFADDSTHISNVNLDRVKELVKENKKVLLEKSFSYPSPLHNYLNSGGCNPEIIKVLIDANGEVLDLQDGFQETPLHIYLKNISWKKHNGINPESDENVRNIVSMLATKNNISKKNYLGKTPLMVAVKYVDTETVSKYLTNEKSINEYDVFGKNALVEAIERNDEKKVDLFIKKGGDLNRQDDLGNTPLYYAKGRLKHKLIKRGANKFIKNYNGENQFGHKFNTASKVDLRKHTKLSAIKKTDNNMENRTVNYFDFLKNLKSLKKRRNRYNFSLSGVIYKNSRFNVIRDNIMREQANRRRRNTIMMERRGMSYSRRRNSNISINSSLSTCDSSFSL